MASAVNSLFGPGNNSAPAPSSPANASTDKQMFLQMLVSQIKNQDPLNPVDGTQFVSQLAQFSELEQLIAIRGDLDKTQSGAPATPSNLPGATGGPAAPDTTSNTPGPAPSPGSGAPASQN